jgi:hypothetical protein
MESLWLQIKQQSDGSGVLTLWEGAFEARKDPIGTKPFSLDLLTAAKDGKSLWDATIQGVRESPAVQNGAFEAIGETLRKAVASSAVWDQWRERASKGTRTYLEIVDPPQPKQRLADLPWEYLTHVKGTGIAERYFANENQPMLRVHEKVLALRPVQHAKVLIISGEPVDWAQDKFPSDDVVAALREFQSCSLCAHVEVIETPSLDQLESALDRLKPEVIHFSGHGEKSPTTNHPALKIGVTGHVWWWDIDRIHAFFNTKQWRPRLVVLNTCDARVTSGDFVSLVDAFAQSGAAAVIGAQARLLQNSARIISSALYGSLTAKKTIDVAMVKVRTSLGNQNNGDDWHQRDWGLPVLTVAVPPEDLFARPQRAAGLPDPEQIVASCKILRQFVQTGTRTSPFVALGWLRERWDCLTYLSTAHCIIVKGIPGGGKSRLVQRSLRDAVFLDQRVRYVEVCGSKTDANFIDLLGAIIDGDSAQLGSEIHKGLDPNCFTDFKQYRNLTANEAAKLNIDDINRVCKAFEAGLRNALKAQELTIVLDQFSRDSPRTSFSEDEFKKKLLPYLWIQAAQGEISGLRVVFVVRDDEYVSYDLVSLPTASLIEVKQFKRADYRMLFYELCRFRRSVRIETVEQPALPFEGVLEIFIGQKDPWKPSLLKKIASIIEETA